MVDDNKMIIHGEDKVNTPDGERIGKNKQFIKTYYIKSRDTEDRMDKVLIITKDEHQNKYVDIIEEPHLQFFVTKPEYWDGQNVNYIDKDKVERHACVFKNRYWEIPKIIGDYNLETEVQRLLSTSYFDDRKAAEKLIDLDGRLHGSDINIEDQYINLLLKKYPDDDFGSDYLRKSFFDIEVDGSEIDGFPDPEKAEAPINMITYLDGYTRKSWSYILKYDTDTYRKAMNGVNNMIKELRKENMDKGLDFDFEVIECDTELEVIAKFLENVNQRTTPDFLMAWNMDFDFATVFNRLKKLGQDPVDFFTPNEFPYKDAWYRLDTGANDLADKSSYFMTASYTNWIDQLALYASINKGAKTLESFTLEYVAQEELGEGKADFEGDISNAHNIDYEKFLLYNIQDTMLLYRLEDRVQHLDLLYYMSIMTATRPTHVLKKTISLRNLGNIFYDQNGYIMSNNRSRQFPKSGKKIPGGFVGDPNLVDNIGLTLSTGKSPFIHDDVTDVDLASLYPSTTEAYNISPETHMGKITHLNENGEDDTVHFIDGYNSADPINFGIEFMNLPTVEEMALSLDQVSDKIKGGDNDGRE